MARNKENLKRWHREYYQKKKTDPKYKEAKQKSAKKYYKANSEKCKERRRKYAKEHKEQYRKYRREWRYSNPSGIYSVLKDGLTRKGNNRRDLLKISKDDFIKWYNSQKRVCFYCKRTFENIKRNNNDKLNNKINRLTIDRVDNSKGYENGNLVLACYRCNSVKSDYFTKEEMLIIGKIIYDKNNR